MNSNIPTVKSAASLIPGTLAALATMTILPERQPPSSDASKKKESEIVNPCRTKWQQKWVKLDIVHPKLQKLADEAESFCSRWFKNDTSKTLLVLVGSYGSGKTHVAKAIYKFCVAAAVSAFETKRWGEHSFPSSIFISWPEAADAFAEKQFGIMDDAVSNDLVIVDDIGAENDPWKICSDKLCQILSRREKKFTVVTTNVLAEKWEERFDGRINDRLLRNSIVIDISEVPSFAMK